MDWSIQDVARLANTTSRTLRHYGTVGLLEPSRIGANGYRFYDERSLVRLQRILMLRDLGLGLPAIREVIDEQTDETRALAAHLAWLREERERLARQIRSVENTIDTLDRKEQLMAEQMFDGFDHTAYRDEVEERWGKAAYADGDAWWTRKSPAEKAAWQNERRQLAADWQAAAERGLAPEGEVAQRLARRQFEWLAGIPGTPGAGTTGPTREYFAGLGEMYVADERFAANFGGVRGAEFVRDAMVVYADRHLRPSVEA
ncbi:MerR family transcriptional regulator [Cryobacterium mannosilyticum]|uniref:MerR family transcriptional regulator n=1 Tax=Cryobacterium mannosilyticum TaxID=1259190 RepID=A0A4R8WC17_9MICO|nr:MerR family transcriptional regulator [Cryobacterium mannosilyticum]TFC04870.1 MerR family transcriptional regulator [Cryobacterium mannosilyticum]